MRNSLAAILAAFMVIVSIGLLPSKLAAQTAATVTLPNGIRQIQTVEGITEYRLENGLKVLLAPDGSASTVTVTMTYLVGSRHEGYGESGMAHLLEHLIFKGTPTTAEPKAEFRRRGFSFNGTTSEDRTNYFATFSPDAANLDWYLSWQADAMVNSHIARKDLDTEMTVVRNEFEIRENNAMQVLLERTLSSAYSWHSYGRAIVGARADIENVDIANLQAFYRRFYRPDNAFLLVHGKFDVASTLASVARHFGPIKKPAATLPSTYTLDPAQDGERNVVVRRPATQPVLLASYHIPPDLHPDSEPLQVLSLVLADGTSGRLHKALVDAKLATSVGTSARQLREGGTFRVIVSLNADSDADKARDAMLKVTENIGREPVTAEEFEQARSKLALGLARMFSSSAGIAGLAAASQVNGDWRAVFVSRERFGKVTLDDVNRVARSYLLRENRTVGHLVPTGSPVRAPDPKMADVAAYMQGATLIEGTESVASFDYDPKTLAQRIYKVTTAGGVRLSVAEKAVRGELVTVQINLRFGTLNSLARQSTAAGFAGPMLRRGAGGLNREQLDNALLKLGATLQVNTWAEGGSVRLVVRKEQLAEALKLTETVLKKPDFPAAAFEELKSAAISSATGALQDPSTQVRNEFARYGDPYAAGDPRQVSSLTERLENLKALTLDDVKRFYSTHVGAQNALVAVVGPVSAAAVEPQVVAMLDSWKAPAAYERIAKPLAVRQPTRMLLNTPDKSNATIEAYLQAPIKQTDADFWPMQMATQIFSAKLFERLREKEGLSYTVNARLSADIYDPNATLALRAEVAPSSILRAEALLKDELEISLKSGFSAAQFERQKKQSLAERQRTRTSDEWLVGIMTFFHELDWPYTRLLENDAQIAGLTLEQVNSTWRKYVDANRFVWGLFADQAKVK